MELGEQEAPYNKASISAGDTWRYDKMEELLKFEEKVNVVLCVATLALMFALSNATTGEIDIVSCVMALFSTIVIGAGLGFKGAIERKKFKITK